jgi:hypothetical protein
MISKLNKHFTQLIDAMPIDQQKELVKLQTKDKSFNDLTEYFLFQLQNNNLELEDILEYKKLYRIEEENIIFSPKELSITCAKLLCFHLKYISIPDETQGTFIGSVYLAGTQHVHNISELYNKLQISDKVQLVREKNNPFDAKAVKITTCDNEKLGYIPAKHNLFISQMLDFDISLTAQIRKLVWDEKYVNIKIMIYLK